MTRPLSLRDRNRTLLRRQHLLEPATMPALAMVEHLIGLQAQDNLPPYLSLAARLSDFDPGELSRALDERTAVRLLTMRGTIHVLTPDDALALRPWVQPMLDQVSRSNQYSAPAREVDTGDLVRVARDVLARGELPVKALGEELATTFTDVPASALAHAARERVPLVQVPPRGLWRRSGGVVYQTMENHLGREPVEIDLVELVRRYLRAYGPASAADMTAWSRVTRLGPVLTAMADELVRVECEDGKLRYDVPDAPLADGDEPAPVRLLGGFDNVWLSHADRSLVMSERLWKQWLGPNGGVASTVFVDGFMAGLWRVRDGSVQLDDLPRLTRAQRSELDAEIARVQSLLATPPHPAARSSSA